MVHMYGEHSEIYSGSFCLNLAPCKKYKYWIFFKTIPVFAYVKYTRINKSWLLYRYYLILLNCYKRVINLIYYYTSTMFCTRIWIIFENIVQTQYIQWKVFLCVCLRGGPTGFGLKWPTSDSAASYFLHSTPTIRHDSSAVNAGCMHSVVYLGLNI